MNNDHWIETRWEIPDEAIDTFQSQLSLFGCLGSYEKIPLENEVVDQSLLAYFPDQDVNNLAKKLKDIESESQKLLLVKRIPQENWATEWKKYFKPFSLTKNIVICPSWEKYDAKKEDQVITLDPGMAFGTGQHDTTRFCAELICEIAEENKIETLVDVGCGSGILSFIAKKLGVPNVVGFDSDTESINTAKENLTRNPDLGDIPFYKTDGSINDNLKTYDIVAANIIAEILCDLKDDLLKLMGKNGFLILSGILAEREDLIKKAFKDLRLIKEKKSREWHAYVYSR